MKKEEVLISLIKEVVKNEVKKQVPLHINKMIKEGKLSVNSKRKVVSESKPSVLTTDSFSSLKNGIDKKINGVSRTNKPKKDFSKNPMINEILNSTEPFSPEQRGSGGLGSGGYSVLDALDRTDDEWGEMNFTTDGLNQKPEVQIPNMPTGDNIEDPNMVPPITTGDGDPMSAVAKALSRNYSELAKRL